MISDPVIGDRHCFIAFVVLIVHGAVYASSTVFYYVYGIYALRKPRQQLVHFLIQPMIIFGN